MTTVNFLDLVKHKRLSGCAVCDSHEYDLPFPLTPEIEGYLAPLGTLKYPLDKIAFVKIDNDLISLQGRVGKTTIRVKFKQKGTLQELFKIQLASYIGMMMPDTQIIL